jgi:uncharacterized protein
MTELVVLRLLIDLAKPMAQHWCAGDPFRTALFNALSMSFPMGEQFFIDAVREAHQALPPDLQAHYAAEVRGFIGQEATHRRIHSLFNSHLEQRGLRNLWAVSIEKQRKLFVGQDPRHALAVTAANEHFTAMLAEWLLGHPEVLQGSEDRLQTLWLWHSAEEAEHKNTAFDLYGALGGNHEWRMVWFRRTTLVFLVDVTRQLASNLHRDRSLYRPGPRPQPVPTQHLGQCLAHLVRACRLGAPHLEALEGLPAARLSSQRQGQPLVCPMAGTQPQPFCAGG